MIPPIPFPYMHVVGGNHFEADMTDRSKRIHGTGSVYHRASDGRWVGALIVDGKRKTVSARTEKEAEKKLTRLRADIDRGLPLVTGGKTVAKFLDEWLEDVVKPTKRPKTYINYEYIVRIHLKPALGKHRLEKLTQQHVQKMINEKTASDLAPGTVSAIRRILRAALNQAMKWDLVVRNVVTLTEPVDPGALRGVVLTKAQVDAIFTAVKDDRLEAFYWTALSLGLRVSELFGLRWVDVDFDEGMIHVRTQAQYINGVVVISEPKTESGKRSIPMLPRLSERLRRHQDAQDLDHIIAGDQWKGDDWGLVFCTATGLPLNEVTFRRKWSSVRTAAKLPDGVRFHDLRHTSLSMMANKGAPPATLKAIAGHADIATTMAIYVHASKESKEETTALLADLLPVAISTSAG